METVNSEGEEVEGTEGVEETEEENEVTEEPEEIARNKTTRVLTCNLGNDELLEIAETLSDTLGIISGLENEKSSSSSRLNASIKVKKEAADNLAKLIKSKVENREVECQFVVNWNENKKDLVRLDTNEIIESNALTQEERQLELEYEGFSEDDIAEGEDKEEGEEEDFVPGAN